MISRRKQKLALWALFIFSCLFLAGLALLAGRETLSLRAEKSDFKIHVLDVGQGDAILAQTPYGHNILVDGGPNAAAAGLLPAYLPWYDRTIDLMVLTHPHDDHVGGLVPVLERYEVEQVVYTGVVHPSPVYMEWLKLLRQKEISVKLAGREQSIGLGPDCRLDIIFPFGSLAGQAPANLNNSSIVIYLLYGNNSFLLAGDIEKEAEEELLSGNLAADMVKIPHHGADTSSGQAFIDSVKADYAIISVGADNKFGHPSRRVIKRLERSGMEIYRTDINGTVTVGSDGNNILIETEY